MLRISTAARVIVPVTVLAAFACTEPADREQLRIEIEADRALQPLINEVSAVVEYSRLKGGWQSLDPERFEPKVRHPWPIKYNLPALDDSVSYQLIASARDDHGALVAESRALRDWDATGALRLRVIFESACARRADPCTNGLTCHLGECVDARLDTSKLKPSDDPEADPTPSNDAGADPGGPMLAAENNPCDVAGSKACGGEMSRTPLVCADERVWKASPTCTEAELCDTTIGSQRGTCRKLSQVCRGQTMGREFCDGEAMRVCNNPFEAAPRMCPANARCVSPEGEARCECRPGFVDYRDGMGCRTPTSCEPNNGGCDPLTKCSLQGTTRACSGCPAGYVGDGLAGCQPLLADLRVSQGQLAPAFQPGVHSYRLRVPLLAQRVEITPTASADARIQLNGVPTPAGGAWLSPTLQLGENPVKLTLTVASGETSTYDIVIERSGSQRAYLKASNADAADGLGSMVAISGDTLVTGAPFENSNANRPEGDQGNNAYDNAGAAYVFVKRGDNWEQQAYLKPTDPASEDRFGMSVAVSGDTILLGAIRTDWLGLGQGTRPGVAYVFTREGGEWKQLARLSPPAGSNGDLFGYHVAIDDEKLVVGAPRDGGSGAVYVYARMAGEWYEEQKLKPTEPVAGSMFGGSVAIDGDTVIVGAPDENSGMNKAGSAYVFVRSAGQWNQTQRLTADPIDAQANFGYMVAMHADRMLISAPRAVSIQMTADTDPGEVFAYVRQGTTWVQTQRLRARAPRNSDSFGSALALSGGNALIGACGDASGAQGVGGDATRPGASATGAGYLLALEENEWKFSAYLKAKNPDRYDSFGFSAALGDDFLALGAVWESSSARGINGDQANNDSLNSGAVYVFQ